MNVQALVPFKIKAKPVADFTQWMAEAQKRWILPATVAPDVVAEREWTVVGYLSSCYLLIREGEIAQWYPKDLCVVVGVPA